TRRVVAETTPSSAEPVPPVAALPVALPPVAVAGAAGVSAGAGAGAVPARGPRAITAAGRGATTARPPGSPPRWILSSSPPLAHEIQSRRAAVDRAGGLDQPACRQHAVGTEFPIGRRQQRGYQRIARAAHHRIAAADGLGLTEARHGAVVSGFQQRAPGDAL